MEQFARLEAGNNADFHAGTPLLCSKPTISGEELFTGLTDQTIVGYSLNPPSTFVPGLLAAEYECLL